MPTANMPTSNSVALAAQPLYEERTRRSLSLLCTFLAVPANRPIFMRDYAAGAKALYSLIMQGVDKEVDSEQVRRFARSLYPGGCSEGFDYCTNCNAYFGNVIHGGRLRSRCSFCIDRPWTQQHPFISRYELDVIARIHGVFLDTVEYFLSVVIHSYEQSRSRG